MPLPVVTGSEVSGPRVRIRIHDDIKNQLLLPPFKKNLYTMNGRIGI